MQDHGFRLRRIALIVSGERRADASLRDSPIDIYVMDADGTEWKRIALKVVPGKGPPAVSWGRE
jgi:hypothetical protein